MIGAIVFEIMGSFETIGAFFSSIPLSGEEHADKKSATKSTDKILIVSIVR
jgi:hypothetical protein